MINTKIQIPWIGFNTDFPVFLTFNYLNITELDRFELMKFRSPFISLTVWLASICLAFTAFGQNTLTNLVTKANSLEVAGQQELALKTYRKALSIALEQSQMEEVSYIYNKIGQLYFNQKDLEEAKKQFKTGISEAPTSSNAANSYFNLALIYRGQKSADSLNWALNHALHIYTFLEDSKDKFLVYSKAGILLKQAGKYKQSLSWLIKAYEGFSKNQDMDNLASISGNIGDVQRQLGNLELSKAYYQDQLHYRFILKDSLKLSFAYNNLANLFYEEKQLDSALFHYRKALDIQKRLKNAKNLGKTLSNIGLVYHELKAYENAERYYLEALSLKQNAGDSTAMAQTLNELVIISLDNNKINSAKKFLDQAEALLGPTSDRSVQLRNYHAKSEYYKAVKNYRLAYHYQSLQFNLYKLLFSQEQARTIQTLQEQFESRLKEQQISSLTQDNEKQASVISLQEELIRNKNLLLILLVLIVLIILGGYLYIRQRQKIKIQKLEYLKLKAVIEGQELIKEHISRDLHDMIPTSYDAIRLKLLALGKAKNPEVVSQSIMEDIKRVNRDIRLISHRLSPLANRLKDVSLTEIIVSHFTEFQHYRQIFMDVQLPLPQVINTFSLEAQTNFYGIILEILNNIEKHSKANRVTIRHSIEKTGLLLFEICDNGIGFQNNSENGIGMTNIRQRVYLLGGSFQVESNAEGTCINLKTPIPANQIEA